MYEISVTLDGDLALADQIVDGGFAHVEDIGDLLRGKRLILAHNISPIRRKMGFVQFFRVCCIHILLNHTPQNGFVQGVFVLFV